MNEMDGRVPEVTKIIDPNKDVSKIKSMLIRDRLKELEENALEDFERFSNLHSWYKHLSSEGEDFFLYPGYGQQVRYAFATSVYDWDGLHWHCYNMYDYEKSKKFLVPKVIDIAIFDIAEKNVIQFDNQFCKRRTTNNASQKQINAAVAKSGDIIKDIQKLYQNVDIILSYWFDIYISGNSKKDLTDIINLYYEPINRPRYVLKENKKPKENNE